MICFFVMFCHAAVAVTSCTATKLEVICPWQDVSMHFCWHRLKRAFSFVMHHRFDMIWQEIIQLESAFVSGAWCWFRCWVRSWPLCFLTPIGRSGIQFSMTLPVVSAVAVAVVDPKASGALNKLREPEVMVVLFLPSGLCFSKSCHFDFTALRPSVRTFGGPIMGQFKYLGGVRAGPARTWLMAVMRVEWTSKLRFAESYHMECIHVGLDP